MTAADDASWIKTRTGYRFSRVGVPGPPVYLVYATHGLGLHLGAVRRSAAGWEAYPLTKARTTARRPMPTMFTTRPEAAAALQLHLKEQQQHG